MSDMSQLWVESHEDSHLISASQSVTYTARVRDTGANISCSVSRENQDLCSGTTKSSKCNVVNQALKVMTQQKSVSLQILSTTALKNSRNGRNNPLVDKVSLWFGMQLFVEFSWMERLKKYNWIIAIIYRFVQSSHNGPCKMGFLFSPPPLLFMKDP